MHSVAAVRQNVRTLKLLYTALLLLDEVMLVLSLQGSAQ